MKQIIQNWKKILIPVLGIVFLLAYRFLFRVSISQYSYDYGFYLYTVKNLTSFNLSQLTVSVTGGYNNILFLLAGLLHLNSGAFLNTSYVVIVILTGCVIYSFFETSYLVGFISLLLYAVSLVQLESYSMFLWKNALASLFILLALKALRNDKFWQVAAWTLAVFLVHRTSSIVLLIFLVIYAVYYLLKQRRYRLLAFLAGLGIFASGIFVYEFRDLLLKFWDQNINFGIQDGVFFPYQSLFSVSWPIILLAIPGLVWYLKQEKDRALPLFLAITGLWVIAHLPFYRRVYIFTDLAMILFAGYLLAHMRSHKILRYFAVTILMALSVYGYIWTRSQTPLISRSEIQEIVNFRQPPGFVLAFDAKDAPFLLGFIQGQKISAEGFGNSFLNSPVYFYDPQTGSQWADFKQGLGPQEFLANYSRPVYFYLRSYDLTRYKDCLQQISKNFYLYKCN